MIVPAGPEPGGRIRPRRRDPEDRGRALAGLPGRPHLDRAGAGDPGRGRDPDLREDVREPPLLRRQAGRDGRSDHALRSPPGDRQRSEPASRRARREPRHPRRDGDAHRRPGGRRAPPRSATSARSTAATSRSTSACAGSAPRSSGSLPRSLPSRAFAPTLVRSAAMIHPIPPGTRDVLPDEMRELRRLQRALIDVFESARLRRGRDAGDRVRRGAGPRRRPHRRRRLPLLRRERRPAGAALGHDGADRPPRRQPLRRAPRRRCGSATWPAPTARCARSAARCASSSRPGWS